MTRRVRIDSVGNTIQFVTSLGLTFVSLVETLKALIYWGYYAWNSDDFGLLSRLTTYFRDVRREDSDVLANFFAMVSTRLEFLFPLFIYVKIKTGNRLHHVSNQRLLEALETFVQYEGLGPYLELQVLTDGCRDVLLDRTLIDLIVQREGKYFEILLNKKMSQELVRLRGIRLFRNLSSTVLSLPYVRLAVSVSEIPHVAARIGETLVNLTRRPGSESIQSENFRAGNWARFMSDMSRSVSLQDVIYPGEMWLFRRRRRVEPPVVPESRFEELDSDDEIGESSGTNNP